MEVQGRECKELLSVAVSFLFQLMKHKFRFAGEFNAFICGMGLHRLDVTNYPIKPFYFSGKVRFRFGCRRVPQRLYESSGGNQVDGLPPASSDSESLSTLKSNMGAGEM